MEAQFESLRGKKRLRYSNSHIIILPLPQSNSLSLTILFIFGRIWVLEGGKETSDLAEYFPLCKFS